MRKDPVKSAVAVRTAPMALLNPMAALGVLTFAVLAVLPWSLPLPASRLYSLSFVLSYLGFIALVVTEFCALCSLSAHWMARRMSPHRAGYWLSLTQGLLIIGLSALSMTAIANGIRPTLQTEMLFGLQVEPHRVILSGATPDDMDERLEKALLPGQRIDRVELSGIGGSVEAAERATRILKAHGAATAVVVGECASACATMFEEFPHRYVAPAGRLGFHAFWGGHFNSAAEAQQREIEHLVSRGVEAAYAEQLFASPMLTWPSLSALYHHRLASGCWDPDAEAPVACGVEWSAR